MRLMTKRFGEMEIDEEQIITFPKGIIGFEEYKDYAVLDLSGGDLDVKWLQSAVEPSLGFVIINPVSVFPSYVPKVTEKDLKDLKTETPGDLVAMAVVTVPKNIEKMSLNLQAPILINPVARLAKQVILTSSEYTTKHDIFSALKGQLKRTG